jgi:hypothetical protein
MLKFRKVASAPWRAQGPVSVTVEPRAGFSDEQVITELERSGAERIVVIAPGFISAEATPDCFSSLDRIAMVHVKPEHQLHV